MCAGSEGMKCGGADSPADVQEKRQQGHISSESPPLTPATVPNRKNSGSLEHERVQKKPRCEDSDERLAWFLCAVDYKVPPPTLTAPMIVCVAENASVCESLCAPSRGGRAALYRVLPGPAAARGSRLRGENLRSGRRVRGRSRAWV